MSGEDERAETRRSKPKPETGDRKLEIASLSFAVRVLASPVRLFVAGAVSCGARALPSSEDSGRAATPLASEARNGVRTLLEGLLLGIRLADRRHLCACDNPSSPKHKYSSDSLCSFASTNPSLLFRSHPDFRVPVSGLRFPVSGL